MSSILSTYTTGGATVTAGATLPLGSATHRCGCMALDGSAVRVPRPGYISVDASVCFAPTAAGAVTVSLLDGTVVVASATATSTAADQMIAIPLTATLKGSRCPGAKVLSITVSAAGTTGPTSLRVAGE